MEMRHLIQHILPRQIVAAQLEDLAYGSGIIVARLASSVSGVEVGCVFCMTSR
jgi:hypothetical protein